MSAPAHEITREEWEDWPAYDESLDEYCEDLGFTPDRNDWGCDLAIGHPGVHVSYTTPPDHAMRDGKWQYVPNLYWVRSID